MIRSDRVWREKDEERDEKEEWMTRTKEARKLGEGPSGQVKRNGDPHC